MSFAVAQVLVVVSVAIWAWFLLCRGGFWRADQRLADSCEAPASWPPVAVVIPARDEAETIQGAVRSLMEQDYPGDFTVFVVDDNSSDETADIARAVTDDPARLQVVAGKPLPGKWTGKIWAVAQGLARATDGLPDAKFILLTDADIVHGANKIRRLDAKAEADELDLVSLMVLLRCRSAWERLLIPAFVFFFQMLYPFPWVNDPGRRTAGAAGGCMLVRNSALRRIGGISRLRDKVIDDCALARAIKPGGKVWLGLATESHNLRGYDGLSGHSCPYGLRATREFPSSPGGHDDRNAPDVRGAAAGRGGRVPIWRRHSGLGRVDRMDDDGVSLCPHAQPL